MEVKFQIHFLKMEASLMVLQILKLRQGLLMEPLSALL